MPFLGPALALAILRVDQDTCQAILQEQADATAGDRISSVLPLIEELAAIIKHLIEAQGEDAIEHLEGLCLGLGRA